MTNLEPKVLIVDDDVDILEFVTLNLSNEGFKVYTASNGLEAIQRARDIAPDLIILDVMMPGKSGYELTKEIKDKENTPIILLTAKGEVENRIKGLELGADDYLGKPFEPKELLLRIRNIISKNKDSKFIFLGSISDRARQSCRLSGSTNRQEVLH